MPSLGKMLRQMSQHKKHWEAMMKTAGTIHAPLDSQPTAPNRLTEVTGFGPNPGNLRMLTYVPQTIASSPALVVVLHGCTQNASGYDHGAGWSTLADRYGFVLLFPEQQEANNPKRCFNWFLPADTERGSGEAASIRQMIERVSRDCGIDHRRIFITGLSAGGAMTSTMLATYPELFSAGAIIAGLPYRCATSVPEAFECMFQGQTRSAPEWGNLVRNASSHEGPWPKVSVWHGNADTTVKHMNAGEVIKQWTDVHDLPASPSRVEVVDGYPRRVWANATGEEVIEEYVITGMGHGTPLATGGDNGYGVAGPFLLEAGISSSYHIAKFWGLTREAHAAMPPNTSLEQKIPEVEVIPPRRKSAESERQEKAGDGSRRSHGEFPPIDVGSVITKALKAAGLMK